MAGSLLALFKATAARMRAITEQHPNREQGREQGAGGSRREQGGREGAGRRREQGAGRSREKNQSDY